MSIYLRHIQSCSTDSYLIFVELKYACFFGSAVRIFCLYIEDKVKKKIDNFMMIPVAVLL